MPYAAINSAATAREADLPPGQRCVTRLTSVLTGSGITLPTATAPVTVVTITKAAPAAGAVAF